MPRCGVYFFVLQETGGCMRTSSGWKRWVLVLGATLGSMALGHTLTSACAPRGNPGGPAQTQPALAEPASAAGHWRGYVEAWGDLPSLDEVEVVLTSAADDKLAGSVRIGRQDAAPPSDPTVDAGGHRFMPMVLAEGQTLAISEGRAQGARVRFDVVYRAWQAWCAAQAPGESGPGLDDMGCPAFGDFSGPNGCAAYLEAPARRRPRAPDAPGGADAGAPTMRAIDCALVDRCRRVRSQCECRGGSCEGRAALRLRFDVRIDKESADGSVQLDDVTRRVRLQRVP